MKLNFWKNKKEQRSISDLTPSNMFNMGIQAIGLRPNGADITLSAVYSAVELISNAIAELPIYVKQRKNNKSNIIENHAIYLAINNGPTPRFMMIKLMIWDMLLTGNGYAYIKRGNDGTPLELIYLPANTVTVMWSKKLGQPVYICSEISKRRIEAIDMIHIFKNSKDGWNGIGVLAYAKPSLELAHYTEKTANSFFKNGLNIGGILTTDAPVLTEKQRENIRNAWRQAHNADSMNGLAVLEASMHYQQVTLNGRDAQLLETRLFNLQEVARFFNISPCLLGDLSKSGYSTVEASSTEFVVHTLAPLITLIQEEFGRKLLLPMEKSTMYIDFDESYLIKADLVSTANYLTTLVNSGILSINEARERLGLNGVEGGEHNIIPYTDISQNKISNTNKSEEEDGEQ